MASIVWTTPRWSATSKSGESPTQHEPRSRPLPLRVRTYSEAAPPSPGLDDSWDAQHARHKSTDLSQALSPRSPLYVTRAKQTVHPTLSESSGPRSSLDDTVAGAVEHAYVTTPPASPSVASPGGRTSLDTDINSVISFDFSGIDYQLARAKVLGSGLWSTVYLAEPASPARQSPTSPATPPGTPEKRRVSSAPGLFAVKTPSRRDAKDVFLQEARVLSRLQRRSGCSQYVVPFYGLDERNHALVSEAVLGGSLESLLGRLKQMTEVSRHVELINIFPGIAADLINGLSFLHSNGVVHADIKPGNVLLDISEHCARPTPVIRARFIDFSAAFAPALGDSSANAGGTWSFMAPEQMRIQKDLSTPTFASDVWSLGITLLSILVGASPYTAACGDNAIMLREAVKGADPIGFARMDHVAQKRLAACQDFVDCCRLALKKDRDNRIIASDWVQWLEDQQLGL